MGAALATKYGESGEGVGGAYWFPEAEGRRGKRDVGLEERSRDGGGEAMVIWACGFYFSCRCGWVGVFVFVDVDVNISVFAV